MNNTHRFVKPSLLLLALSLIMFSCVPLKKIKYLQTAEGADTVNVFRNVAPEYRLQSGDYLYIRIFTLDEKSNTLFNSVSGSAYSGGSYTDQYTYLTSYMVNDTGFINFPVVGRLKAAGFTAGEMEQQLHDKLSEYIKEATVIVKLVNYKISMLGEVGNPGQISVNRDRISIFEAIAMAGDLNTFANRKKVQIIRQENQQTKVVTFDLTRKEILNSEFYYLKPNDIVYVEPLKGKQFAFETFPYSLIYSTISMAILIVTFFK
ncbi:MAG TPA: polysaccharide biosynthesis/export family protein [Bacteroidales bacterium]|nr:polysaccharide biosynthesis/export family protein [Bacteroidales bacterium]